ncbi:MAG: hypothetical protein JXR63_11325 [Spirochaetales bacterium]|nr:hypothetical protein [Spirochaetales bacterium]
MEKNLNRWTIIILIAVSLFAFGCDNNLPPAIEKAELSIVETESDYNQITLKWNAASNSRAGGFEYLVYISTSDNIGTLDNCKANGTKCGEFQAGITQKTIGNLNPETEYWFNVIVRDEEGNESIYKAVKAKTQFNITKLANSSLTAFVDGKLFNVDLGKGKLIIKNSAEEIKFGTECGDEENEIYLNGTTVKENYFDSPKKGTEFKAMLDFISKTAEYYSPDDGQAKIIEISESVIVIEIKDTFKKEVDGSDPTVVDGIFYLKMPMELTEDIVKPKEITNYEIVFNSNKEIKLSLTTTDDTDIIRITVYYMVTDTISNNFSFYVIEPNSVREETFVGKEINANEEIEIRIRIYDGLNYTEQIFKKVYNPE